MHIAHWWDEDWPRSLARMIIGWFVVLTAASIFLLLFGDLIYAVLG